jgi:hypothetical protein
VANDTKAPIAGEWAIEIDTRQNDAYLWPPTQDRLRGAWSPFNYPPGSESSVGLFQMPPFPGMQVRLNPRSRQAMIVDPLENNPDLMKQVSERFKHTFQMGNKSDGCTWVKEKMHDNLSDDQIATWLYWMMRAVNSGFAKPTQGSAAIPRDEREVIKLYPKSKIKKDHYNSMTQHVEMMEADEAANDAPAAGTPAKA